MKKSYLKYIFGLIFGIFGFSIGLVLAGSNYAVYEYPAGHADTCMSPKVLAQENSHYNGTLKYSTDKKDYINVDVNNGGWLDALMETKASTYFRLLDSRTGSCNVLATGDLTGDYKNRQIRYKVPKEYSARFEVEAPSASNMYGYEITFELMPDVIPDKSKGIEYLNAELKPGQSDTLYLNVDNIDDENIYTSFKVNFYYSTDNIIRADQDVLVGSEDIDQLLNHDDFRAHDTITIPPNAQPGKRWIGAIVDADNNLTESDETNNKIGRSFIVISKSKPDLTYSNVTVKVVPFVQTVIMR